MQDISDEELLKAKVQVAPPITDWINEPTAEKLQEDLTAAKTSHDSWVSRIREWNDLLKAEGNKSAPKLKGRSKVQPKVIRRQNEWRYSALSEPFLGSDKLFDVSPVTFEDARGAEQNDLVLNYQFRNKLNKVKLIDSAVRALCDDGTLILRTGWKRITVPEIKEVPVYNYLQVESQEEVELLDQALALKNDNIREYNETIPEDMKAAVDYLEETGSHTYVVQVGITEETIEKIIDNRPTVTVLDPENVYIDPSCGDDLDKAHFAIISFETSKAELLKEPDLYHNLEYVNWENNTVNDHPDHESRNKDNFNFKDRLRKRVVAYEYWGFYDVNGDNTLVPIVATWIGNILIRLQENPFPDQKIPLEVSAYLPLKRELLGEPDAELLKDNQAIIGALSRGMIDLMGRSANGQQGYAKGFLDAVNKTRFNNGQDYEFNPNMPPSQAFVEHKYPEVPQSALLLVQQQNQEAESLSGVKAFSGGISGNAYGNVATAIRGALDAAAKREMAILRRLADCICRVGKKIISMNSAFLSEEETIRITNEKFVTVKREDLIGNFDLKVDISTAEVDDTKAKDLSFMLQTMGNTLDFGITKLILVEFAKLRRMPELANAVKKFEPAPNPLQELEVQIKQKELEKLNSEIELNRAKAQQALTQADQNNLDTVEQETGTKHARDIEKQTGQAQGNQDLEITKALLNPTKPEETNPDVEAAIGWNQISKGSRDPRNMNNGF